MGEPPDRLIATTASKPAVHIVRKVIAAQSRYWNCLYPKAPQTDTLWTDRVHGIRLFHSRDPKDTDIFIEKISSEHTNRNTCTIITNSQAFLSTEIPFPDRLNTKCWRREFWDLSYLSSAATLLTVTVGQTTIKLYL
jgi:hypothetical protein